MLPQKVAVPTPHAPKRDDHEADLYFWMSVHHDAPAAEQCLGDLRRHYPKARVVLRGDGDNDPRLASLREAFAAEVHFGPRLFPVENGSALVIVMLEMFLATDCRYLLKIDPDTHVHRPLAHLPQREGIFGTLQGAPEYRSIQGGCLGMTRQAAQTLYDSGLLASPDLRQPERRRAESDYWRILADRARDLGLASFDWSIGWAAKELGIDLFEFAEVRSQWLIPVENDRLQFAITHPRPAHEVPAASTATCLAEN